MTIKQALQAYPTIEADLLLSHVLEKPKEFLFLHPQAKLSTAQLRGFTKLAKRRLKGEPYTYIVGYKYFCGLKFAVNKNVLIPRPESEWLVERAEQAIETKRKDQKTKKLLRILDLGTGSGCLAVSFAKKLPANAKIEIYASDVSKLALAVAKKNARSHHLKIKFTQSSLFKKIPGRFDLVIANLPYVPIKDYRKLHENLKYEPKLALVGGKDGQLYKRFFSEARNHLETGAILLLEMDPSGKKNISLLARRYSPAAKVSFYKDMNHLWRYAVVKTALAKNLHL